jgi:large subunit ribosomal protein L16
MALMPRRVKHRKSQRGRIKGNATRGHRVSFGDWGLQSTDAGHISAQTIEACRIAIMQYIRGEGTLSIRIFPHRSVTARPLETRMGKGKGEPDHWVAVVKPGTVLFEVAGVSQDAAKQCFARVAYKLPVRVKLIGRAPGVN